MSLQSEVHEPTPPQFGPPRSALPRPPHRWLPIRALADRHRTQVREHLLALSAQDRALRFGYLASDETISHYADQLDFEADEIFGIFDRRLRLVGLAHLAFGPRVALAMDSAEFGVSVLPSLRGRGAGSLLFEHAVTLARNRGVDTLLIHLARDNGAMLAIVRRAHAKLHFEGMEAMATMPLPAYTLGSQIKELLNQQAAELDYRLKLQVLRLDTPRTGGPE